MKATKWPTVGLGDHVDLLTGFPFKSSHYTKSAEDIRLLRGDNVAQGTLRWDGVKKWPISEISKFSKYALDLGDIVLAMDRPWIEAGLKWAYCKEVDLPCLLVQRVARLRGGNGLLTKFLRYVIADYKFTHYVKAVLTGVNVPHISGPQIQAFKFHLPPVEAQRKIAAILSAYDDLIENNTRRIRILEEMAQLLYREWFVHFRFPGHVGVRMVKGVPEGWEAAPIGQSVETLGGSTPSTKNPEFWEGGDIIWFTPSDLTANKAMFIADSSKKITDQGLKNSSARIFPAYSVMMTSRATIGVTAINTKPACTNQGFITCIPNERVSVYQLYFWIAENKEKIENVASGATYKEINRTEFREFPFFIADPQTNARFVEVMTPMGKQIENLLAKNANLRRTRDLLLPRLVSGEVEVEGLEIGVGM